MCCVSVLVVVMYCVSVCYNMCCVSVLVVVMCCVSLCCSNMCCVSGSNVFYVCYVLGM